MLRTPLFVKHHDKSPMTALHWHSPTPGFTLSLREEEMTAVTTVLPEIPSANPKHVTEPGKLLNLMNV